MTPGQLHARASLHMRRPLVAALLQTLVVGGTALTGIAVLSLYTQRVLLDDLRRSLGQIATTTAALVDADVHARIVADGRATPGEFAAAIRPLVVLLRTNPDLRFAYTAIFRGGRMFYVLDADPKDDPSVVIEPGPEPALPGQFEVWRTERLTIEQQPSENAWGTGIRAYAPVRDREGRMIAFLGVTMKAERYMVATGAIRTAAAVGAAITLLLALLSGVAVWRLQRSRNRALESALEASKVKSEFLGTMSHEIRTPLNAVLGMTELILRSDLAPQQHQRAQAVHVAGQHLLHVVNEILDFSKIEAGQLHLEAVEFDLVDLVEETTAMFARPAQEKGLELVVGIDAALGVSALFRGDPFRLRQILVNLVGNAVKFTGSGEVMVSVALLRGAEGGTTVEFSVADTGIGIEPEAQRRIFEQFSQADGSTTRRYGGTGLGLAICKSLVDLMSGTIRLESAPGHGARFMVRLALPRVGAATEPTLPAGARVLVVDDNPTSREVLRALLAAWGMTAMDAASGPDALEAIERAARAGVPFALVLVDLDMPGMGGIDLAAAIGARAHLPRATLVLLTASGDAPSAGRLEAHHIAACMTKPVRRAELLRILRLATARPPALQRVPAAAATPTRLRGRVLLAEDSPINLEVAEAMLAELGLEVTTAGDGREAIDKVRDGDFDLVLMDCQMPVMDGYAATGAIRELTRGRPRRLPIVAVTANVLRGDEERCIAAGMDAFLAKPYTFAQVYAVLAEFLPAADMAADGASSASALHGFPAASEDFV
jgi:signal transduction histidine kinase/DNA-binding response OmpR family regulator